MRSVLKTPMCCVVSLIRVHSNRPRIDGLVWERPRCWQGPGLEPVLSLLCLKQAAKGVKEFHQFLNPGVVFFFFFYRLFLWLCNIYNTSRKLQPDLQGFVNDFNLLSNVALHETWYFIIHRGCVYSWAGQIFNRLTDSFQVVKLDRIKW